MEEIRNNDNEPHFKEGEGIEMSTTSLHVLIHIRDALCAPFRFLYIYYLLLSENIFGKGGAGLTCPNKTEVVETLDPIDAADRLLPRLPT